MSKLQRTFSKIELMKAIIELGTMVQYSTGAELGQGENVGIMFSLEDGLPVYGIMLETEHEAYWVKTFKSAKELVEYCEQKTGVNLDE